MKDAFMLAISDNDPSCQDHLILLTSTARTVQNWIKIKNESHKLHASL